MEESQKERASLGCGKENALKYACVKWRQKIKKKKPRALEQIYKERRDEGEKFLKKGKNINKQKENGKKNNSKEE